MKMGYDFCADKLFLHPQGRVLTNVHAVFCAKLLLDLYKMYVLKLCT